MTKRRHRNERANESTHEDVETQESVNGPVDETVEQTTFVEDYTGPQEEAAPTAEAEPQVDVDEDVEDENTDADDGAPSAEAEPQVDAVVEFIPARPGTYREASIKVMKAHPTLPMVDVLPLIQAVVGGKLGRARSFYVWNVKNNRAPGTIPAPRTVEAPPVRAEQAA